MKPNRNTPKVVIKNNQKRITVTGAFLKSIGSAVKQTFLNRPLSSKGTITIALVNDKVIRELNLLYLGEDSPTDVLSFNIERDKHRGILVADIIISTDTAVKNAKIYGTTAKNELLLYVIHGSLHLLGYNDNSMKKRNIMEKEAYRILSTINHANS
ncbi:MAG: rRNA maturation RNase YbeY [Candidatus Omnitrophica bacterium]|nr:rRNA maturation RNase YbeY [Candidatus Omnitrophota bacterium]